MFGFMKKPQMLPLLIVLLMNIASLFLLPKIGSAVEADMGTDGWKETAENIIAGKGFISVSSEGARSSVLQGYMKREPIYPLFLSAVLGLTGTLSPLTLCLFHTVLSLVSCGLIYRLGERVFGASAALIAMFLYAFHPVSFWYSTRFASETITIPAMLFSTLLAERFF